MDAAYGTDDASVHDAIDNYFSHLTWQCEHGSAEWTAGRQIAHQAIEHGFPARKPIRESFRHRFAAESLAISFAIPGSCDDVDWRWQAFYDTLHTVPGFPDPITQYINFLDIGRPWFGAECPDEGYYGNLTSEEAKEVLAQCEKHRGGFEADADARYCIGPLISLFRFASERSCSLWYGFG